MVLIAESFNVKYFNKSTNPFLSPGVFHLAVNNVVKMFRVLSWSTSVSLTL